MHHFAHFLALQRHLASRRPPLARLVWWLRESARGLLARGRIRRKPVRPKNCDVLLLHPSEKSRRQRRKADLLAALRQAGLNVEEEVASSDRQALHHRLLQRPPGPVPASLYLSAARAADLLARYRAKVILTERNGWPTSTFLRAFRPTDTRILHLAHGVLTDQSTRLRYHDYDYYAVFGASSLDYLLAGEPGFGATRVVFAGPYFPLPARRGPATTRALLFLGAGPDEESGDAYLHSCELARGWLANHPDWTLWVRPHPRGSGQPWRDLADHTPSIRLRPDGETLDQALAEVAAVWCGYTTAIIDCAIAGLPVMVLGRQEDYFLCDHYGLPRLNTPTDLEAAMEELRLAPRRWEEQLDAFARFHVAHWDRPLSSLTSLIRELVRGNQPDHERSLP